MPKQVFSRGGQRFTKGVLMARKPNMATPQAAPGGSVASSPLARSQAAKASIRKRQAGAGEIEYTTEYEE